MNLPERQHLPHEVPLWIDPSQEIYFLTLCCDPRGLNQLCQPDLFARLAAWVRYREGLRQWFVPLGLAMPDHLHLLAHFPPGEKPMRQVVTAWKSWTAKELGIRWQRDFFEHRLRKEESRKEKADYILANPVRVSLVERAEAWPYVWLTPERQGQAASLAAWMDALVGPTRRVGLGADTRATCP
jgi:putative transposase